MEWDWKYNHILRQYLGSFYIACFGVSYHIHANNNRTTAVYTLHDDLKTNVSRPQNKINLILTLLRLKLCQDTFMPNAPQISERALLCLRDPTLRPLVLLNCVV